MVKFIKRPVTGKCNGIIAAEDIPAGDVIMSKQALLELAVPAPDIDTFLNNERLGTSSMIQDAVRGMSDEHRKSFRQLYPARDPRQLSDQALAAKDIDCVAFNSFSYTDRGGQLRLHVLRDVSFINHSCVPNANQFWDPNANGGRGQAHVYALVNIKAGDEVLITYNLDDSYQDIAGRRAHYQASHNFVCSCTACPDTSGFNRSRRERVQREDAKRVEMHVCHR